MATFEQIKNSVQRPLQEQWDAQRKTAGRRARMRTSNPIGQGTLDAAWNDYMRGVVLMGVGQFPDDLETAVLDLHENVIFTPNTLLPGGMLRWRNVPYTDDIRVSVEAAADTDRPYFHCSWATVQMPGGEVLAMTIEQAYRRGLREVSVPRTTTSVA